MDKQNISEKNVLGTYKTHGDLLTCGLQISGATLGTQVGSAGSELTDS